MIDQHLPAFLYAEDDPDDRLLAEMAHRESGVSNPLVFVSDGEEALECLRLTGRHADRTDLPRPAIVLLDLNMPGIDGRETLRIIRADPAIRRIPVVVLTTSTADDDIAASYDAGANAYIVKPTTFAGLVHIFTTLAAFWFTVSSLAKEIPQ
jgi:two-component system response regulator